MLFFFQRTGEKKKKNHSCNIFTSNYLWLYFILSSLTMLDSVYHAGLWFVFDSGFCTFHCRGLVGFLSAMKMEEWKIGTDRTARLAFFFCVFYWPLKLTLLFTSFLEPAPFLLKVLSVSSWCALQRHLEADYLVWKTTKRGFRTIRPPLPHVL